MRPIAEVSNLIVCLTKDEDLQQELWVHYLSGSSVDGFSDYLNKLKIKNLEDSKFRENLWDMLSNPIDEQTSNFLDNFTHFEKSIICLSVLGLSTKQISEIKGISEVRIKQSFETIRYNECWSKYGTQEKSNRRRKTRSK